MKPQWCVIIHFIHFKADAEIRNAKKRLNSALDENLNLEEVNIWNPTIYYLYFPLFIET